MQRHDEDEDVQATPEELAAERANFLKSGLHVVYCPNCSMPPEFCEFGPKFDKCKPWLIENFPNLYPHLKEEAQKKAADKKAPKPQKPKGKFYRWTEIEAFHYVRKKNIDLRDEVSYRGKVKLHGTNAAVAIENNAQQIYAQSRNMFILEENDHHGFLAFMLRYQQYFRSLVALNSIPPQKDFVVFGEWCGKGICKGASVCTVEKRFFGVFSIQVGEDVYFEPEQLQHMLDRPGAPSKHEMVVIPWQPDLLKVVLADPEQLRAPVERLNELVDAVDKEDPFVAAHFGVRGTGEGLVWYPVSMLDADRKMPATRFSQFIFKTKGHSHAVQKSAPKGTHVKTVHIDAERVGTIDQFVDMFVTEARLEQGLQEVMGGAAAPQHSREGTFVNWMEADVKKESVVELQQSGLEWDRVREAVRARALRWFTAQLNAASLQQK